MNEIGTELSLQYEKQILDNAVIMVKRAYEECAFHARNVILKDSKITELVEERINSNTWYNLVNDLFFEERLANHEQVFKKCKQLGLDPFSSPKLEFNKEYWTM